MDFIFDPSLVLYLPLHSLDGAPFQSKDAYGHLCTRTGAIWTPRGHSFDGADDKIDCGEKAQFRGMSAATWITWFKHGGGEIQHLISKLASGHYTYQFYMGDDDKFNFNLWSSDTGNFITHVSDNAYSDTDKFYCAITTWDGGLTSASLSLMVDGQLVDVTGSSNGTFTGMNNDAYGNLNVGADPTNATKALNGILGEVWLFARALTLIERQNLYLATKWRYR